MYPKLLVLAAAGLLAFTACDDTGGDTGDVDDSGVDTNTGPLLIMTVAGECDANVGEDGTWYYEATTNGWTTDGVLFIDQDTTDPWSEEHDIVSVDFCEDGSCDELARTLEGVFAYQDQVVNQTTLFDCNNDRASTMMWMIQVYDLDDNVADCVVWGADVSIYDSYSCENANNW